MKIISSKIIYKKTLQSRQIFDKRALFRLVSVGSFCFVLRSCCTFNKSISFLCESIPKTRISI